MSEVSTGSVIKKDAVRQAAPTLLSAGPIDRPDGAGDRQGAGVKLLQQTPAGALLEVTCGCGKTTRVSCLYAAPALQEAAGQAE